MKTHLYTLLFALIALNSSFSANATCFGNGYIAKFNALTHQMSVHNSEQFRQQLANQYFENNCFTHIQLNQVLNLMRTDAARYNLAISAHKQMDDTTGFYTAQYVFQSHSYKSQFRSFLRAQNNNNNNNRTHYRPYRELQFPNYQYPQIRIHPREAANAGLLNEGQFLHFASRVNRAGSDYAKKQQIENEFSRRSFTTEQFMKLLSLVRSYDIRFELATRLYGLLYDVENAEYLNEVFERTHYSRKFSFFLQQNNSPGYRNPVRTPYGNARFRAPIVSNAEMNMIMVSLKNEPFSSKRVELAKTIISTKPGLSSQQIGLIVSQMSFDSHKLDVAKFGYAYAIDRENYFTVANQLTFSSNRS
jgi:hypothetical protein